MAAKYSAEWIRKKAVETNTRWLTNHDCGLCGVDVGYIIHGDHVDYRSGCGCSWSDDRPSSFEEIANWLAVQSSDEVRDRIIGRLK